MTHLIGIHHDERHACAETHLPNCYNPQLDLTACECGEAWWRGQVGTWHSRQLREVKPLPQTGIGIGAVGLKEEVIHLGWDRYFLHLAPCRVDDRNPSPSHRCRRVKQMTAAQVFGRIEVAA